MNLRESIPLGQLTRGRLFTFLFFALTMFAAWKAAQYVLADDLEGLAMIGLGLIVAAIVVIILNNWRNGLYFFLSWLLFEDLIRKFLGNNMAIYFGKDFLVLVVYVSFYVAIRRRQTKTFRPPFLIPLLLFVWFGAMQIFNPASPHIAYGLLGFKLFFFYSPLVFVGYALIDSEDRLRRLFTLNQILALIIVCLGIAQAVLGHTFLNPERPAEELRELSTLYRVSPITGLSLYRPTSVFVSDGRFGNFIDVSWPMILGFSGYLLLRQKKGRALTFLCVVILAAGAVLTGSRGVVMWAGINGIVFSVAFLWGAPWRQGEVRRALRTIQRAAIATVLGVVILGFIFPEAVRSRLAFYSETLNPNSPTSELLHRSWDYPVRNFLGALEMPRWQYGNGIGTNSLGVQYITRFLHVQPLGFSVESGFGTIVLEMGIGGLALWLLLASAVLISGWRIIFKLRGSPFFPIAFVIFWYSFFLTLPATFAGMQPYQDFLLNSYFWLLLGVLHRLPTLAVSAANAPVRAAPATSLT